MQVDISYKFGKTFSEEEEEEFFQLSKTPNLFELFSNSVAPQIYGHVGFIFN